MLPREFLEELARIRGEVQSWTRRRLAGFFEERGLRVEPVSHKVYKVYVPEGRLLREGILPASLFHDYRWCARRLWLRLQTLREGYELMTVERMRRVAVGILAHRLWAERYAAGETEVELLSREYGVGGRADEVIVDPARVLVVEVKTGVPDPLAARLQVMAYIVGAMEKWPGREEYRGVVLYPRGSIAVTLEPHLLREYVARVRAVLESDTPPPRLPGRLSERCGKCSYRPECRQHPDPYVSYQKWLTSHGFTVHQRRPPKNQRTLF